ncbi:MAG: GTPase [Pirellulaceae bacterium]
MNRLKTWWLCVVVLLSLPYLVLFAVGSIWLYQYDVLWYWLLFSGLSMAAGWWLAGLLRGKTPRPDIAVVKPSPNWAPSGEAAWQDVEDLAQRMEKQNLNLASGEALWQVLHEVLHTVAAHYRPKSKKPELDIPLPHALHITELVARDLRRATSQYVPGAHILTINDLLQLKKWTALGQRFYVLYRLGRVAVDPLGAVLAEIRDFAGRSALGSSTDEVRSWAVGFCVRKAGYYAIQLYSGNLVLEDVDFASYTTEQSRGDAAKDEKRSELLANEPLRMLVLGQVKAGKSSLINALFGETRAAVDVVPRTKYVEPYVLEREGMQQAIILDTAGYEDVTRDDDPFAQLHDQILDCDIVVCVCAATSAARAADRHLLDAVRTYFHEHPDRVMPPVIVALTQIDRLRPFNEWNPPYDVQQPSGRKAQQIVEAMEAVAEDLEVSPLQVIPVCLKEDRIYNVEEGVAPAILQVLSEANRVKYLRCVRHFHKEERDWRRVLETAVHTGRILWKIAREGRRGATGEAQRLTLDGERSDDRR